MIEALTRERNEALSARDTAYQVRDLARAAANRDLEAKRQAEAETRTLRKRITTLEDALQRNRQGLKNILQLRKLHSAEGTEHGERFGSLTREEIETVIAEIDAALLP